MKMTLRQIAESFEKDPDTVFFFEDEKNCIFEAFPSKLRPGEIAFSYTLGPTNIGANQPPDTEYDVTPGPKPW